SRKKVTDRTLSNSNERPKKIAKSSSRSEKEPKTDIQTEKLLKLKSNKNKLVNSKSAANSTVPSISRSKDPTVSSKIYTSKATRPLNRSMSTESKSSESRATSPYDIGDVAKTIARRDSLSSDQACSSNPVDVNDLWFSQSDINIVW